MRQHAITLLAMLIALDAADAAEVLLRSAATLRGAVVRLGDVAEIHAADAATAERLAATPLMPTPAAGAANYLRPAEVRDLLASRGVDIRALQFAGAEVTTISAAAPAATSADGASTPSGNDPTGATADQLTAAIVEYLRQQTHHELWRVEVDADDDVLAAFRSAGDRGVLAGGKPPWSGRQQFIVSGGPGGPRAVAYARVERLELAAFATRAIERGEIIRRSDVELRPHAGALPKQAVASLDAIVGKEAVQGIRADSLLQANQVRSPLVVRRGERVAVRARTGGISVRTYALAQQDGALGDLVTVQSLEGKEQYAARVSGLRELEIFAAGAEAREIAAAADTQPATSRK